MPCPPSVCRVLLAQLALPTQGTSNKPGCINVFGTINLASGGKSWLPLDKHLKSKFDLASGNQSLPPIDCINVFGTIQRDRNPPSSCLACPAGPITSNNNLASGTNLCRHLTVSTRLEQFTGPSVTSPVSLIQDSSACFVSFKLHANIVNSLVNDAMNLSTDSSVGLGP